MNEEIMVNELIEETTDKITTTSSGKGKGFKVAAGVGLTVLVGVVAYKYVIKPVVAKIKAQKEQIEVIVGGDTRKVWKLNKEEDE